MIMNLNILVATVRSFKMLIGYTMDLTPTPLLRLAPIPPPKEREDEEIALKFPLVVVLASCGPCKFFCLHLGTNFLSFDWDLLAFSFANLFLF